MANFPGTQASDEIAGTAGNDVINLLGGEDRGIGRQGNDSITGGLGDDELFGDAGNDTLRGGDNEDYFEGGAGNDIIDGGGNGGFGGDTVSYRAATSGVTVNLVTGRASDGLGGTDTLIKINEVFGSAFADVIIGTDPFTFSDYELFDGGAGNDTINGGGGYDFVSYYENFNNGSGRNGVVINMAAGTVRDGFGDTDRISGIEELEGTRFSDIFTGNAEDDSFNPYFGADTINGGGGVDAVIYSNNVAIAIRDGIAIRQSGLDADLAAGTIVDISGRTDTVVSIENVYGTRIDDIIRGSTVANTLEGLDGDDVVAGRAGNDFVGGGDGSDRLFGNGGADELRGGTGDDYMRGGAGADRFVFGLKSDYDTIRDFTTGSDKVDLTAYSFASGAAVKALAAQDGSSVILDLNEDSTIEFANTTLAQIAAADFLV